MAATTPTVLDLGAGIRRGRLQLQWSAYSGAGSLGWQRVRVYDDASKTTLLWDSGFVAAEGILLGDGWMDVWPYLYWDAASGTQYHYTVTVRNNLLEDSSESATASFTMAAAEPTGANWREAQ